MSPRKHDDRTTNLAGIRPDATYLRYELSPQARIEAITSILANAALRRHFNKAITSSGSEDIEKIPPVPQRRT